jgi:hypothetical protein
MSKKYKNKLCVYCSEALSNAGVTFILKVKEVTDDFRYDKIKNPYDQYQNEESYCYGNAILIDPDKYIEKTTFDIDLLLTSVEFSHLKYILGQFFAGAVDLWLIFKLLVWN